MWNPRRKNAVGGCAITLFQTLLSPRRRSIWGSLRRELINEAPVICRTLCELNKLKRKGNVKQYSWSQDWTQFCPCQLRFPCDPRFELFPFVMAWSPGVFICKMGTTYSTALREIVYMKCSVPGGNYYLAASCTSFPLRAPVPRIRPQAAAGAGVEGRVCVWGRSGLVQLRSLSTSVTLAQDTGELTTGCWTKYTPVWGSPWEYRSVHRTLIQGC